MLDALDLLAEIATVTGGAELAARVLGVTDRWRAELGMLPFDLEPGRRERTVDAARAALGDAFDDLFADGRALDLDEAVAYVRRGRGQRGRPSSGWASLTPAELDVVRLVTEGLQNPQIAEALFISTNTVKTHLSHVYAKLGSSSRAEVAAEAARRL
jgi:DNA-binding CsgD family transcriptional regulator